MDDRDKHGRRLAADFVRRADPSADPAWQRFSASPDPIPSDVISGIFSDACRAAHGHGDADDHLCEACDRPVADDDATRIVCDEDGTYFHQRCWLRGMRLVIIESPYAGSTPDEVVANVAYSREAMLDSLRRGEAPMASHLIYTQVLDDADPVERTMGILAGLAWGRVATMTAGYADRGISGGMRKGIEAAAADGRPVEFRNMRPRGVVPK